MNWLKSRNESAKVPLREAISATSPGTDLLLGAPVPIYEPYLLAWVTQIANISLRRSH